MILAYLTQHLNSSQPPMSSKPDLLTSLMNANLEVKPKATSQGQNQHLSYGNYNQHSTPNPNQSMWNSKPQSSAYHSQNNNNDVMGSMSSLDAFLGPPLPGQKVVNYPSDPFASTTSLLKPQSSGSNSAAKNNKNSVQLSQQDILNFLN